METLRNLPAVTLNVRFLLWSQHLSPDGWASGLSRQTRSAVSMKRASEIISGDGPPPTDQEMQIIADAYGQDPEQLLVGCLYTDSPETLLKKNVSFLLSTLLRGGKKSLAGELDVQQETIARWSSETKLPEAKNVIGLLKHMGLPADLDLRSEPLFLSTNPVGWVLQRKWLIDRIEKLPSKTLPQLFPALWRILKSNDPD